MTGHRFSLRGPKALSICHATATHTRPSEGEVIEVKWTESLERAHTKNFLDAIISGTTVSAPLQAGIEASLPVQMALRSYWTHKIVSESELT